MVKNTAVGNDKLYKLQIYKGISEENCLNLIHDV